MKQTIMSRLQEIYQSVPAHITDDDEIMREIAYTILYLLAVSHERRPGKV
jgi:hypothetical protein